MIKSSVVSCASLSSVNPDYLVSGCTDGSVQQWDITSSDYSPVQNYTTCPPPVPASDIVSSAWSYTDLMFAVGNRTGSIYCGDVNVNGLRPYLGHQAQINGIDFHPYGNVFSSASRDTKIKLWDVRAKDSCIQTFNEHKCNVTSVVHSPDGQWLVSGDEDGVLKFWDLSQGKCFRECSVLGKSDGLIKGKSKITKLVFHPLELILTCVLENNQLAFWDVENFQLQSASGKLPPSASIEYVQYHPYGKKLYSFGGGNIAKWTWEPTVKGSLSNGGWNVGTVLDMKMDTKEDVGSGHIVIGMGNTTSIWKLLNDQEHTVVAPYAQDYVEPKITSPAKLVPKQLPTGNNNNNNIYSTSSYSELAASASVGSVTEDPLDMYSKLHDYSVPQQTTYTPTYNNNNNNVVNTTNTTTNHIMNTTNNNNVMNTTNNTSMNTTNNSKAALSATTNQNILAAVMNAFSLDDTTDTIPPYKDSVNSNNMNTNIQQPPAPQRLPTTNGSNNNNNGPFEPRVINFPLSGYRDEPDFQHIPVYNRPSNNGGGMFSAVFMEEPCNPIIRKPRADGGDILINCVMADSPYTVQMTTPSYNSSNNVRPNSAFTPSTSHSIPNTPLPDVPPPIVVKQTTPTSPITPIYTTSTPTTQNNTPTKQAHNSKDLWDGTLIPASAVTSGVSGNLDPSAFLPQSKYSNEPLETQYDDNAQTIKKSVNVEQVRTDVLKDHPTIISVLSQRMQLLQTLQEFWKKGELPAMLDCLAQMRDPPLVYDVLHSLQAVFLHGEKSSSYNDPLPGESNKVTLSLQDASEMLRVLAMLIQARFEHYVALGVQYTQFITKAFYQVVKDTLGNRNNPNAQKTMASEEREGKVKKLVKLLKNMQAILNTAAKKHTTLQKDISHVYSLIDSLVELL